MPYIPTHGIRTRPKPKPFEGVNQNNYSLYNSQTWRRYRADYLKQNPLCVMCASDGVTTEAYYVDHIKPINQGGSVWIKDNHQSLCKKCHAIKSAKDGK